jgi:pyruvate,water dikinase
LVQDGVSPQRWINKWGTWTDLPSDESRDDAIAIELIDQIVRQTKEIAATHGRPVDLEWVYDGQEIHWVQMREITTLDIPIYSNRITKEVFPGIIKPLVWSINVPLVNGAWMALFSEIIGPNDIQPESLAGRFYCHAYFNISALGQIFALLGLSEDTLELLLGIEVKGPERPSFKPTFKTFLLLPRIIRFGLDKAVFDRKIGKFLSTKSMEFATIKLHPDEKLSPEQLLLRIENLFPLVQMTAYNNNVISLSARLYNRILQRQLDQLGVEFDKFDLTENMDELNKFNPNVLLSQLANEYQSLPTEVHEHIRDLPHHKLSSIPGTETIQESIALFSMQFGHLSNSSSDFSQKPWREDPDLIWQMVQNFIPPVLDASSRIKIADLAIPILKRPFFKFIYNRARKFQLHREEISSLYTYGYGLYRDLFLELGRYFKQRSLLEDREEVFFLKYNEIIEAVKDSHPGFDPQGLIKERKDQLSQCKDILPPETIFGDQAPLLETQIEGKVLTGIPTSRGVFTGAVRVLSGLQDMKKIKPGDVLVVPYSDVGWTPLFAQAGAIVAESGGILSHCSIVAREYGIPAIVSVPGACQLADDTMVIVDGDSGRITTMGSE